MCDYTEIAFTISIPVLGKNYSRSVCSKKVYKCLLFMTRLLRGFPSEKICRRLAEYLVIKFWRYTETSEAVCQLLRTFTRRKLYAL